jgi:hypothetical protein
MGLRQGDEASDHRSNPGRKGSAEETLGAIVARIVLLNSPASWLCVWFAHDVGGASHGSSRMKDRVVKDGVRPASSETKRFDKKAE